MSDARSRDPRLVHALALLQDWLQRPQGGAATFSPPSDDAWLASSTDVLTPWYPESSAGPSDHVTTSPSPAAWNAYFAGIVPSFRGDDARAPAAPIESFPFEPRDLSSSLTASLESAPAPADSDAAEAVIEALYGFLHAIGRADVPAAIDYVAADYHAMEGDREITRDALRQQLEDLVDARRDRGLQISLAQVPEPIASPYGVLVRLTVQIDSRGQDGTPQSLVLHRVAVFRRDRDERWLLAALGVAHPVP